MRFPIAALLFIVLSFIFGIMWAVTSLLVNTVEDAMLPYASELATSDASNIITLLPWAFGIICAIFFVTGILLIFVLDSIADEPEYYYRS